MKKKVIIIFFLIFIIYYLFFVLKINNKKNIEKDFIENEFFIKKVKYYSSANAVSNTTNYQNPEWNLNVYQFTDIAIYLAKSNSENNSKNYIYKLFLENFDLSSENAKVFYLNPVKYGNSEINDENVIDDKIEYNVINSSNVDNDLNYNVPIFFQDCSNPLTLRIVTTLSNNYKVSSDKSLIYNGSLIRELGFSLNRLNKNLKFDMEIENSEGSKYDASVELEIPYNDGEKSIFDGDFQKEDNVNICFVNK